MVSDLISRQAAMDALDRIFDQCEEIEAHLPKGDPDRTGYKMYPDYMTVWKYLHQLPSAEPEIVRCEDCKHLFDGEHNANCCEVLMRKAKWLTEITVDMNWSCADGERRRGE